MQVGGVLAEDVAGEVVERQRAAASSLPPLKAWKASGSTWIPACHSELPPA
jgi:hypothetical protein